MEKPFLFYADRHPLPFSLDYSAWSIPERAIACFRVRMLQRSGETIQEYFSFQKFRGEAKALAAARRRWRELRQISPKLSRQEYAQVERRASPSGIVGVTRVTKTRKGRDYDFWCASYTGRDGVKRMRVFSVSKYGEKPAKRLAIAARQEGLAELAGRSRGGRDR